MKQIKLATNYNKKLGNTIFTHIDRAPKDGIPEKAFPMPFEIITADCSHPPIEYELISITRGTLQELYSDAFTMPSHGMGREEFREWYLKTHPGFGLFTPMAIYFYRLVCK